MQPERGSRESVVSTRRTGFTVRKQGCTSMDFQIKHHDTIRLDAEAAFRFGIEEEYFLCDAATMQPATRSPDSLFRYRHPHTGASLGREMLQAQLEVATQPHCSFADARDELVMFRSTAARAAADHGLKIIAAGTHPTADWRKSVHSRKERYHSLMNELQIVGRRNMLCGMHVHVEVPDPERRIDVMTRLIPYLPLLLALSTSSPFWRSECTGLKGYRLAAYDELPRTGLPELFWCQDDYDAYVAALVKSSAIEDASHIWWAIRPSTKYPTLELRAPDCCTRVDHSVAIAALYRVLVRHLYRHPALNADLDAVDRSIAVENKWRAQRYGIEATLATRAGAISVADMLHSLLEQTADDADALGCADDAARCRGIVAEGTSADAQLKVFLQHDEVPGPAALDAVMQWLAQATVAA